MRMFLYHSSHLSILWSGVSKISCLRSKIHLIEVWSSAFKFLFIAWYRKLPRGSEYLYVKLVHAFVNFLDVHVDGLL